MPVRSIFPMPEVGDDEAKHIPTGVKGRFVPGVSRLLRDSVLRQRPAEKRRVRSPLLTEPRTAGAFAELIENLRAELYG